VTTYPLLDPRKKIIFIGTKEYREQIDKDYNDSIIDIGIFRYTEKGFIVSLKDTKNIEWNKIESIFGYKLDLMTTDEICIEVFCDDCISFRVTEETPGWFVFIERLKEQFSSVEEDWNINIAHPAFATNLKLLYDRKNRPQEQVVPLFYGDDKKKCE
jgi:hypothetical protein